jgi:hypothetical protein
MPLWGANLTTTGTWYLHLRRLPALGQACISIDPTPTGSDLQVVVNSTPGPALSVTPRRFLEAVESIANLRVLAIDEVKSVAYAAVSHPFIERLVCFPHRLSI